MGIKVESNIKIEQCKCGKIMYVQGIDYDNYYIQYKCKEHYMQLEGSDKNHNWYIKQYAKEEFENLDVIKSIRRIEAEELENRQLQYRRFRNVKVSSQ